MLPVQRSRLHNHIQGVPALSCIEVQFNANIMDYTHQRKHGLKKINLNANQAPVMPRKNKNK
jgi:hypothetical protein